MVEKEYLLDTNAVSFAFRKIPEYLQGIASLPEDLVLIPAPVRVEVENGLNHSKCLFSEEKKRAVRKHIDKFPEVPLDAEAQKIEQEIKKEMGARGIMIKDADAQIAAVTMSRGGVLVTDDLKDMGRIRGLEIVTFFEQKIQLLDEIKKEHKQAESQIIPLNKRLANREISEARHQIDMREILGNLDHQINEALNVHKQKIAEQQQRQQQSPKLSL